MLNYLVVLAFLLCSASSAAFASKRPERRARFVFWSVYFFGVFVLYVVVGGK